MPAVSALTWRQNENAARHQKVNEKWADGALLLTATTAVTSTAGDAHIDLSWHRPWAALNRQCRRQMHGQVM